MKTKSKLISIFIVFLFLTLDVYGHGKSHAPRAKDVGFSNKADHNDAASKFNKKIIKALAKQKLTKDRIPRSNKLSKKDYFDIHNQKLSVDKAFAYKKNEPMLQEAPPDGLANSVAGSWSDVYSWDVVAIHATLLPNGKVLIWDATPDDFDGQALPDRTTVTRVRLWDPASRAIQPINYNQSDLFCAGSSHLWDGRVLFTGGDTGKHGTNKGDYQSALYDPYSNSWDKSADMHAPRWYASVAPLPNGEMITLGGTHITGVVKPTDHLYAEIFQFDKTWRPLNNVPAPYGDNTTGDYQWVQTKPNGEVIVLGPHSSLHNIKTSGEGQFLFRNSRDGLYRSYGSYALYEHDKALISGGGLLDVSQTTNSAVIVNLNNDTVVATSPMNFPRRQHNLTVLADGSVVATGGIKGTKLLVDLNTENQVMNAEIWKDGNWTTMAKMQVTRQYHSVALLLLDGSVLSAGTGYCGECSNIGLQNKYDYEIFYPPYLYKAGSEVRIPDNERLQIINAPDEINYDQEFQVTLSKNTTVQKAHFIKLGSVTHSQNQGQRLVKTIFQKTGATGYTVKSPVNRNYAPPGHYMLVMVDQSGEPSIGKIIKIGQPLLKAGDIVKDKLLQVGKWNYYRINPNGNKTLNVRLSGLSASADVYVEQNFYPDENSLQDKKTGNTNEQFSVTGDPQAAWYIGVKGDLGTNYNLTVNLNNSGDHTVDVPEVTVAENNELNFKLLCYSDLAGELTWDYDRNLFSGFDVVVENQIVDTVDQNSYYIDNVITKFNFIQNKNNIRDVVFHITPVLKPGAGSQARLTYKADYDANCGAGVINPVQPVNPAQPIQPTANAGIELEFLPYSQYSGELIWKFNRDVHSGFIISMNGNELRTISSSSYYIPDIRQEAIFLAGTNNISDINYEVIAIDLNGVRVDGVEPVTEPVVAPVTPVMPSLSGEVQTTISGAVYSRTAVEIFWEKIPNINEYFVYSNGNLVGETNGSSLWLDGIERDGNFAFQLFTKNTAGVLVASSNSLAITTNPNGVQPLGSTTPQQEPLTQPAVGVDNNNKIFEFDGRVWLIKGNDGDHCLMPDSNEKSKQTPIAKPANIMPDYSKIDCPAP